MTAWVLVLTHLCAAGAGGAAAYLAVVHWNPQRRKDKQVSRFRRFGRAVLNTRGPLALVLAGVLAVVIGLMALQGQRQAQQRQAEQEAYSECITEWGGQLVGVITRRSEDRAAYDVATQERADAFGVVVAAVIGLRQVPPEVTEAQFNIALQRANQANAKAVEAGEQLRATQQATTYTTPTLACGEKP